MDAKEMLKSLAEDVANGEDIVYGISRECLVTVSLGSATKLECLFGTTDADGEGEVRIDSVPTEVTFVHAGERWQLSKEEIEQLGEAVPKAGY